MLHTIELCEEETCNDIQSLSGFCRLHYIKNWRTIKESESQEKGMSMLEYLDFLEDQIPKSRAKKAEDIDAQSNSDEEWVEKRNDDYDDFSEFDDAAIDNIMKNLRLSIP